MTGFTLIDRDTWAREPYFQHYFTHVPCTYSVSAKLDITALRRAGLKLYPAMLYCLTTVVNRHPEFRTSFDQEGRLGIYDSMHPCYAVFHGESQTFSNLWTEYSQDYPRFLSAYEEDKLRYGSLPGLSPKPGLPKPSVTVSMLPWTTFEGFNLNLQKGYTYLLPIFTMGRFYEEGEKILLPLALQVHHAVCDGFHACRFINELQALLDQLPQGSL